MFWLRIKISFTKPLLSIKYFCQNTLKCDRVGLVSKNTSDGVLFLLKFCDGQWLCMYTAQLRALGKKIVEDCSVIPCHFS